MSLLGNLQPPPEPKMRNGPQVRLHIAYLRDQYKAGVSIAYDDELMLNVLRCHLTY